MIERLTRLLLSRSAPILLGSLTAFEVAAVWGTLSPVAVVHDEAAYLLQAKIFATGHWTAPARPLPEFFEQFHVLVTPVLAGKYPPGHPLFLVPGVWLGLPGLIPVILSGLAGGLLFLLARRLANPWVALLTWLVWTTSPGNLRFLPSYLSQDTTIVLWLAGWFALVEWLAERNVGWLMLLSACVAWGVLTRPFTMVGYAAAVAFIAGKEISRRRAWRDLAFAALLALCVLAIIPIWSVRTTGSTWTTPYALYSRIYFPYQRPGFGLPAVSQAQRPLPPDMARYGKWYRGLHETHTLKSVPRDLLERVHGIASDTWGEGRWPLLLFAFVGLVVLPRQGLFALMTGVLLVLSHIPFAHPWPWSVYYLELQAPLAFATALGLWVVISAAAARPRSGRRTIPTAACERAALVAAILALAAVVPAGSSVVRARRQQLAGSSYHRSFRALVASIPEPHTIVFVRYGPEHFVHWSLIGNEPDLADAKVWIVYDRGTDNFRLMKLAPERAAYLFDDVAGSLTRVVRPA